MGRRAKYSIIALSILLVGHLLGFGLFRFNTSLRESGNTPKSSLQAEPASIVVERKENDDTTQFVRIELVNRGTSSVRLQQADVTCGCTVVDPFQLDILKPGGRTTLRVKVVLPEYGERLSRVLVHTSSQNTPIIPISLLLKGKDVNVPFASGWPTNLYMTGHRSGQIVERELTLRTMEAVESEPWLTSLQFSPENGEAHLIGIQDQPGITSQTISRLYSFRIQVPVSAQEDQVCVLKLVPTFTQEGQRPVTAIRVESSFVPAVRAIPRELFISLRAGEKSASRALLIAYSDETPLMVAPSTPRVDWLRVSEPEYLNESPSTLIRLNVRIELNEQQLGAVPMQTEVHLKTTCQDFPQITVPVRVHRAES